MSKLIRVCVLNSSYEKSNSALKEFDGDIAINLGIYGDTTEYTFVPHDIHKATAYRDIRALVHSREYDVFFNMCDGAREEDRAGEEVVRALEEFQVPFTGVISKYYELSKPDMKIMAHYANIYTAPYAELDSSTDVRLACAHLQFPVIVKHVSGYASIGMSKDCKCETMDQLVVRSRTFIDEYQVALVEEFVTGDEVTVLACEDSTQADGVRVYHPVQVRFPEGEDFKHFNLKWQSFEDMQWFPVRADDPALEQIMDIGRRSFKEMMGGIGYGRCDLRIDRQRNRVVFLELNPNCGVLYPPGQEGSADWILRFSGSHGHQDFISLSIREAIERHRRERPLFRRHYDPRREYHLRAAQPIAKGTVIMPDEGRPVRLVTLPYVRRTWDADKLAQFHTNCWPVGGGRHYYAVWDLEPSQWRSFNHSCSPNMDFGSNRSLNVVAIRDILAGEELTMDYRTFADITMTPFKCNCEQPGCCGMVRGNFSMDNSSQSLIDS